MTRTVLALLAALLARAALGAPVAALPPGLSGDVEVTADRVTYEPATGKVLLDGHAVIRRGAIVLRARSAEWDPANEEVRASGGVLLTDPTRVVAADAIRAVLGGELEAEGVLAFVKDRPIDLSEVQSAGEAGRLGRNRLAFSTPRLRGDSAGHLYLSRARLTLCDCPGGAPPSWEITAVDVDVLPGVRAILRWPLLRISPPFAKESHAVPLLRPPWLYLPLGERQSGLLIPTIGSTGASGLSVAQPLFLTLGRSADATVTAEYAFGRKRTEVESGEPAVRGPGARLELRWAPAEEALGRAELSWLHDLDAEPLGEQGSRGALLLTHAQRVGATSVQAGVRLAGDPVWVRDTNADVLLARVPYRRSDVLVSHGRDAAVGEVVASYLQPLDPLGVGTGAPWDALGTPWGTLGASKGVSSRFGTAAATLLPASAGPLLVSGRVGTALFGPIHGLGPEDLDVVGRPRTARGDARAELAVPLLLGRAVTFAPFVRAAALGYAPEGRDASASSWGIAGAFLETEVSRPFDTVRHAIAPRLEWRAGTGTLGDTLGVPAFDLYDRSAVGLLSASPGQFQQLRASVETRLEAAQGPLLRAELGQELDLRSGRLEEAFGAVSFALGPVTGDSGVRFFPAGRRAGVPSPAIPSRLDRLSEFHAGLSVQDRRGDSVRATYFSVGPGGSGRLLAGLDPLFDVRPGSQEAAASASLGARAVLGQARLGYDAALYGRAAVVPGCSPTAASRRVDALQVQQHTGTLTWDSPCRCFRLVFVGTLNDCGVPGGHAMIDLGQLGGTFAATR